MMKMSKLAKNTYSSLILQVITIICGFILPRFILSCYGSAVNGLVNSITQFLSIIAFLDLGVGAVFQSSLYKPLAEKDTVSVSKIYISGQKFFTRLAKILLLYVVVLIFVLPTVNKEFGFAYTAMLILAMSISSFAQYYFGMTNGLLLTADQRGYIQYNAQIVTLLLNTVACIVLIKLGASIHVVKLVTSIIYLARPLVLKAYVEKHFCIDKTIKYDVEPIKQKWNGLAQHIAFVILDSTDTIVLTLFSTLSNVSIYSVYFLVISGLKQLFVVTTNGIQALIGQLYAQNNREKLIEVFGWTEWVIHTLTTFIFGCTSMLIIPFVLIYTIGITDANYNQPLFSALLTIAYAFYCLRMPYHIAIKAGVHYKETQRCYLFAAIINIVISVVFVKQFGLIGVAIGTLIAMAYQTIWTAWYNSKNIICWPFKKFLKQIITDLVSVCIGVVFTSGISIKSLSITCWVIMGIKVSVVWLIVILVINLLVYREYMKKLLFRIRRRKINV